MDSEADIWLYLEATHEALTATLLEYTSVMPMSLITIGKMALLAPGKVMRAVTELRQAGAAVGLPSPLPRWPLYVIAAYQTGLSLQQRDSWREALPGAVAIELAMAAADLLDELTDDDPSTIVAQYGAGQALNTGCLMLVMAQQVLSRAAASGGGERALAALGALQEMLVEAAVGQHLDMLYGSMDADEVTLEMSAGVTEKKAGALIAGACRVGALLAGAEPPILDLLTRIGREIGGIAQVVNDIQDVMPGDVLLMGGSEEIARPESKTDLRLHKRTLPIVFTLRDDSVGPNALQLAFRAPIGSSTVSEEDMRQAIVEAGGVQFANLIIEVHEQNILQLLSELEELRPGARQALSSIVVRSTEYQVPSTE